MSFIKILLVLLLLGVIVSVIMFATKESSHAPEGKVCFQNNCFHVELAQNPDQWQQGLMFRTHLDKNQGMLFVYPVEETYSFWMKNTLIPLDIIWMSKNKEVVFVKENAQPCGEGVCEPINPPSAAQYVLEVNAGTVQEIGLKTGDTAAINFQ